tara:strand:+ start:1039 stop:2430 length:1392 start_codon:yes stop_codon:yes gene_type:complete
MSEGSLLQLVAKGAQDNAFYTKDLTKTEFIYQYPQITNYTMGDRELLFIGTPDFNKTCRATIKRHGDLLYKTYISVRLPELNVTNIKNLNQDKLNAGAYKVRWNDYPGISLIKNIKIYIGGTLIDSQSGHFSYIWNDLTDNTWDKMVFQGQDSDLHIPKDKHEEETVYIPLTFWFTYEIRQALPLIALQYHEVEIEVEFNKFQDCVMVLEAGTDGGEEGEINNYLKHSTEEINTLKLGKTSLLATYIYLDKEERMRFAQSPHEYLIFQVQSYENNKLVNETKIPLDKFNHPTKMLLWSVQSNNIKDKELFNFTSSLEYFPSDFTQQQFKDYLADNLTYFPNIIPQQQHKRLRRYHNMDEAKITLNGHDKIGFRDFKYFSYIQPHQHQLKYNDSYAYMYSFANDPKVSIPTSTLNFSRIDTSELHIKANKKYISNANPANVNVYAISYNTLRIMSGMGGLAYSN